MADSFQCNFIQWWQIWMTDCSVHENKMWAELYSCCKPQSIQVYNTLAGNPHLMTELLPGLLTYGGAFFFFLSFFLFCVNTAGGNIQKTKSVHVELQRTNSKIYSNCMTSCCYNKNNKILLSFQVYFWITVAWLLFFLKGRPTSFIAQQQQQQQLMASRRCALRKTSCSERFSA